MFQQRFCQVAARGGLTSWKSTARVDAPLLSRRHNLNQPPPPFTEAHAVQKLQKWMGNRLSKNGYDDDDDADDDDDDDDDDDGDDDDDDDDDGDDGDDDDGFISFRDKTATDQ